MAANLPMAAGGQQLNLAQLQAAQQVPLRLPNGGAVMVPAAAYAAFQNNPALLQQLMNQQQQAALQQNQNLLAGAGRGALQNALLQQQQQRGLPAPGGQNAVLTAQQQQQMLLHAARLQAAQAAQLPQPVAAAIRPAQPQPAAQPLPATTANFTPEQLDTLREQIVVFKQLRKTPEQVTAVELAKCKPKPLPAALQPRPASVALPPAVAVAAAQGAVVPGNAAAAAVRPVAAGGLPMAGIRPAIPSSLGGLTGAQQQPMRPVAGLGRGAPVGGVAAAAVGAAGRGVQPAGRPAAEVAVKAEPPAGPSHPPMDEPVRRPAGPILNLQAYPDKEPPNPPPMLMMDVPRLLKMEYHKRLHMARVKRQHELDALLKSGKLPVGHSRAPDGTPGRAAVLMELRMIKLTALQMRVRAQLEKEQEEINLMQDRDYKLLQKNATKYKKQLELQQQQEQHQRWAQLNTERQAHRKLSTDKGNMFKEMHKVRNMYLARLHERLARDLMRQRMGGDDERRMDALRQNDFDAYRELLRQTHGPQTDEDRFKQVDEFLQQTEKYIKDLTHRLVSYKAKEEAQEAAIEAIAEARINELSEEEVKKRAEAAQQENMAANELLAQVDTMQGDAQSTLNAMAHNVAERITRAPVMLKPPGNGKLRDYQLMGLEWMVSLYNNKLNGILADEMGLGKTVQVMALLAYLYYEKSNYGPHLIIVPNAVMVNWKAELQTWLPDFRCVYYTGTKDERAVKFQQEVQSVQFNILVTTYETIMRDRNKLSKLEWKYIIIDEAQRMKDRESKLSQDLNRFTTARRLLLTGTPLQNELKELWALLNLLLPDVFNDQKTFSEWFTNFLGSDGDGNKSAGGETSAMDREKRVLVVNRLHQILSPFMLRRMVKDVEQQLPEKKSIVVKCPMSAYQSAVYNWVKATNTVRVDPIHRRVKPQHTARAWEPLQNKLMELRKVCNHPRLCYPDSEHFWEQNVVRTCGKMYWLDQILVKLYATGHRVLLFSTMTRMLDTVEFYLNWRKVDKNDGSGEKVLMKSRRIDGATILDNREAAIKEFNKPDSEVFIFLLSIRAAGRGLNLQTADTVIIYDPDANPKNEEQAIARSHRIGQTKEVRVLHLEAVADPADETHCFPPEHYQQRRSGPMPTLPAPGAAAAGAAEGAMDGASAGAAAGAAAAGAAAAGAAAAGAAADGSIAQPPEAEQAGQQVMFADSIESLLRNVIQKQKIDMANEVIDAGSFDNLTNDAERRQKLEAMLLDEERLKTAINEAPSLESLNRKLARTDAEFVRFQEMDKDKEAWPGELMTPAEVPDYLHFTPEEVKEVLKITERKPTRVGIIAQAERRQQEQAAKEKQEQAAAAAAAATAAAAAAPSAGKPPLPHAGAGRGVRPSMSMVSLQGAAGTSHMSGAGEEEGEEVVGGAYEDIEEEVVDDRNIDEEFERQLEQQEDQPGSQPRTSSKDGTPGKQQGQRGSTPQSAVDAPGQAEPVGAAAQRQLSPFAASQQQQPQHQQTPIKVEGGQRVTFADQQQAGAAASAGQGMDPHNIEDMWEDAAAHPGAAVPGTQAAWQQPYQQQQAAWQQQPQAPLQQQAQQQEQQDWQQWQQQQPGANGAYQLQMPNGSPGHKRSWAQAGGSQGLEPDGPGASGGPALSGGPSNSQQPSASTGGTIKKIKLKGFKLGGSKSPAP